MQVQSDKQTPSTKNTTAEDVARRAWQRPTLLRLHVSLDTAFELGSASDGGQTGSLTGQPD